jgi:IS605 OrfB family transposase
LRKIHKKYNSQLDANAIYDARALRKAILKKHRYPKKFNPQPLFRKQDFKIEKNRVSLIYKPHNRLDLTVFPSDRQLTEISEAILKGARLVKSEGDLFLNLVLEREISISPWKECETTIGVDIGVNYIAVCSALQNGRFSNPLFFDGGEWKYLCDRKRKTAHSKEFKKLTRRQHEILHTISKRIIEYAKKFPKSIIVLEKFNPFKNGTWNKRWNFLLSNWARRKLQQMIEYKARWEGIPVAYVNPAYTSLTCHYCGSKGVREGLTFKCQNCARQYNADANAAMNLAKRFRQLLDKQKAMTGERFSGDLRSPLEGKTYLPRQTYIQPGNGNQMKRMRLRKTLRLPLGIGGD